MQTGTRQEEEEQIVVAGKCSRLEWFSGSACDLLVCYLPFGLLGRTDVARKCQ